MKKVWIYILLALTCLVCGFLFGRKSVQAEVITKTEYRTVHIKDKVPDIVVSTGKMILVPVAEDKSLKDSVIHLTPVEPNDSVSTGIVVELPEEIKEYSDSTKVDESSYLHYKIGVKGYNPSLAYADFTFPERIYTPEKKSSFGIKWGIVGGFGYGIITRKPDFFIGAGIAVGF